MRSSETTSQLLSFPSIMNDDTTLQGRSHQKLHSCQMIRALGKGYMPFAEQLMVNLRIVLASYVLNPQTDKLSDGGRLLMKYSKQWLYYFIGLLRNKKIKIRSRTLHSDYLKQISPSAQEISSRWAVTRSRKTRSDSPANKQRSCNCPERQAIWRRKGKLVVPT